MTQVDLETLVCGRDAKVACETQIDGDAEGGGDRPNPLPPAEEPDFPAESFLVKIGDDIDWTEYNAVYERDDSTKGNANPKSHNSNPSSKSRSNSQRFSGNLKPKAPIIGLPNKIQHSGYAGRSARRPANTRIFPKKSRSVAAGGDRGKSAVPESEPGSPKVSCIGKVLSQRERDRFRRHHGRSQPGGAEEDGRTGCWTSFSAAFQCCVRGNRGESPAAVCVGEEGSESPEFCALEREGMAPSAEPAMAAPPRLGGMKRFSSGRRPASWSGDLEDHGHVAHSGPL